MLLTAPWLHVQSCCKFQVLSKAGGEMITCSHLCPGTLCIVHNAQYYCLAERTSELLKEALQATPSALQQPNLRLLTNWQMPGSVKKSSYYLFWLWGRSRQQQISAAAAITQRMNCICHIQLSCHANDSTEKPSNLPLVAS